RIQAIFILRISPDGLAMAISVTCECGTKYQIKDKFAGQRTRCRTCNNSLLIPEADMVPMAEEVVKADELAEAEYVGPQDGDFVHGKRKGPKKARPKKSQRRMFEAERALTNKGVLAGILMIAGAVVWFVLGLVLLDVIFFYPPILFIIGLIALIRGLASR